MLPQLIKLKGVALDLLFPQWCVGCGKVKEAKRIGENLGIDWSKYDVEQYRMGLDVELEHGLIDPHTNVTNDDAIITGKIVLAHLNEFPDYYTRLDKMEKEAEGKL